MECNTKAFAKPGLPFPLFTDRSCMDALHLVVIGGDDGFLAGKIIVGSAGGNVGGSGDVSHGRGFKARSAKQVECGRQNQRVCFLACWLSGGMHWRHRET